MFDREKIDFETELASMQTSQKNGKQGTSRKNAKNPRK